MFIPSNDRSLKDNCRGVEQLAARQAHNLEVAGSSPAPATKKKDYKCEAI